MAEAGSDISQFKSIKFKWVRRRIIGIVNLINRGNSTNNTNKKLINS